ncbi:MAG: hypothetical protein CM1200mP14_21820 [Gammaproteobacteria bacterium]|nr:MAG: hypothetical protein CM1200mP14_21820 [Gammaproteobacteria bacterium]
MLSNPRGPRLQRNGRRLLLCARAKTGEERWHINLGSRVHAGPMSYMVDGRQYVAIAAGNVLFTFAVRE